MTKDMGELPDDLSEWPNQYQYDVAITGAGPFVVYRDTYLTTAAPLTDRTWPKYFSKVSSGLWPGRVQLPKKIPYDLLLQATCFFAEMWQRYHRQDVLIIFMHEETHEYRLEHPELVFADGLGVQHRAILKPDDWVQLGTIHSHGHSQSSLSGQDKDAFSETPGVHVIVSVVDPKHAMLQCFGSDGKTCWPVSYTEVFEAPKVDFPNEWIQDNVGTYSARIS